MHETPSLSGLRLMECVRLRVKDVDLDYRQIMVRDGKGQRDGATILPETLREPVQNHIEKERQSGASIFWSLNFPSESVYWVPWFSKLPGDKGKSAEVRLPVRAQPCVSRVPAASAAISPDHCQPACRAAMPSLA